MIYYMVQHLVNTTNVAKIFSRSLNKNLAKFNKLLKIFNKNTVKVTYICMGKKSQIIKVTMGEIKDL